MVYNNYGMNGSTMSNYVTSNNPMVVRYTQMTDNNPDIVIIEGGRNDYNKSVPMGENGSTDTKTMKGAARFLISKVQEKYPNALIICLTVWEVGGNPNSAGYYCSDYGRALLEVCADMGVPCINAMDQEATGVKMTDSAFRAKYCMKPNDISHLNADGMKLVLPAFEKAIADFYAAKIK
ncbi:MAG: SGNH/GDSL hydrolase family protein, partial [Clostridia bacterium]|nr:SGNH/GDSL hydrolase family protein [Clostridia bacterium]